MITSQIPENLESTESTKNGSISSTGKLGKWITTATAAILLSACAAQSPRRPDVVVIQNTPYNGQNISIYKKAEILDKARQDVQDEIRLREAQERLDAKRARNVRNTNAEQIELNRRIRKFEQEQGRKILGSPQTQTTPPASERPISIYPDTHPHGNIRY